MLVSLFRSFAVLVVLVVAVSSSYGEDAHWVTYPAGEGPGQGKHVVFLSGDEEYRSEEALPMLAKIVSQRHGFRCTVLFAVDPETGEIDPDNRESLPGAEALDDADAIVMALRFRAWPDEAMARFVAAYERGVPIVALRTSTHPFAFDEESRYREFNDFGKRVLGEGWVNHWGRHKAEATRGVIEPAAKDDPLVRGVGAIFGDTNVYEVYPPEDVRILVRGKVLADMSPDAPPADYRKERRGDGQQQHINDPMMPIAWTRIHENPAGNTNRIFCTTMGAATDLESEGLRRLVVHAVYWGLEMEVPEEANVEYVDDYQPTDFGFDGFQRGLRPADFALNGLDEDRPPDEGRVSSETGDTGGSEAQPVAADARPFSRPLSLEPGERIAFVGNSLAERMNLFGHFEAILHLRFPRHELVVRNFGWPGDAVARRQRPNSYTAIDDPFQVFGADTLLCFFGFNESFADGDGEVEFRAAYHAYLDEMAERYPRRGSGGSPRFVLISPTACEPTSDPHLPDAAERNQVLARYAKVVAEVADERGLRFVDLFTPTARLFAAEPEMQYTINGCHLNEAGDREVARLLERKLFGGSTPAAVESPAFAKLRAAVIDKSWHHLQDYRKLNGWYVYGGRRTWDTETFPREYEKIRAMVALRDRYLWDLAQGKSPPPPDDASTGELYVPPTRFGHPRQSYSEPDELRYLTPEESIEAMTVPEGFEVRLFASEREFPELANPVQLKFDNRGRLWVACAPTYPQWKPGDERPSDRLLILEDTTGDGRADRSTVFYDKLHCPMGFEFFRGGVLVVDQPRLVWLKDTTGDDRADQVVRYLDGWATDDTHHAIGAFEYSHGGRLHMLEGISMSTTVETPWGPHRNKETSGVHVLDPRSWRLRHFMTPGYGNPWCYVFNAWGQGFVGDGTGARQHWDSPLSGAQFPGRRGLDPVFDNQGMRPAVGSDFLLSRHLPDDVQGQFIYACVINMNGIPRFAIYDDSAGYRGHRVMRSVAEGGSQAAPDDLLASTDKSFRPVDPQIGPDGAVWFGDWCNALIGHMQYSQRDPNRDKKHGRIYRLVYTKRPLLEPVTQYGRSETELLEQLREYEPRTRYRVRRELRDRPTEAVVAAVNRWVGTLDRRDPDYDRLRCEALWVLQGHRAVDPALLYDVLEANTPDARAAATRIAADERAHLPMAETLLRNQVHDAHPRVRLEAVRGLSFFASQESVAAALAALDQPLDPWLQYTLEHTIGALEPVWIEAFQAGTFAADNAGAQEFVARFVARQRPGLAAESHLAALIDPDRPAAEREASYAALEKLTGDHENGAAVFQRVCASCHQVGETGYEFGPELTDVAKRLQRRELIESILEPSKSVDPKYVTTTVITIDGQVEMGFVQEQTDESLTLLMAEGKRQTFALKDIDEMFETPQSSMPENLASTMAPAEFLDVIEYLSTLK